MAITKRPWTSADNSARRKRALMELATIGLIGAGTVALIAPVSVSLIVGAAISTVTFIAMHGSYRFEIPENTSALLVGPDEQLQVGQGWYWKRRGEVVNADNITSSGVRPSIELREGIEGSDEGNRVEFVGAFGFIVSDTIIFNNLGSEDQAIAVISRRVRSDFKDYCFEKMRGGGELRKTDAVIDDEKNIRNGFLVFIKGLEGTYLKDYGVTVSWSTTLLDNVDYDEPTKETRRAAAAKLRSARVERERQDILTEGVEDKRLAFAADEQSAGVKVEAFELDINVGGDPAVAGALGKVLENPAAVGIAANAARAKTGDKK